jgi:hypothetical protein
MAGRRKDRKMPSRQETDYCQKLRWKFVNYSSGCMGESVNITSTSAMPD